MTVIMLLEDIADRSEALIEAAVDLSRILGSEMCCLDRSASMCGAPVARAIRQEVPGMDEDPHRCEICLDRYAEGCRAMLRQAAFIVSRSATTLERALASGYGPALLIPPGQAHFRLAGRALVALRGSGLIARKLEGVLPLLRVATAIELVTLRGAALSDAQRIAAALDRKGVAPRTEIQLGIAASDGTDLSIECRRFRADWCLIDAEPAPCETGIGAAAARLLRNPPCPMVIVV